MSTAFCSLPDNAVYLLAAPGYAPGRATITLATGSGARLAAALTAVGAPSVSASAPLRVTITAQAAFDAYGLLSDPAQRIYLKATGLAGEVLSGLTLEVGTDQSFGPGDVVAIEVNGKTLGDVHTAINAAEATIVSHTSSIATNAAAIALRALDTAVVHLAGSYADPAWITSLAGSKVSGSIAGTAGLDARYAQSISLTTPSILYSSPITLTNTSGAFAGTLSLIAQSANTVLAGPTTGANATPTMRALVAADIPTLAHSSLSGLTTGDPHTQYPVVTPATAARNTIQPTGASIVPLTVKGAASQTANLQEWQDSTGAVKTSVSSAGVISAPFGSGANNERFGAGAGAATTTGRDNVYLGHAAGATGTDAYGNVCIGSGAGLSASTGKNNVVAIGYGAVCGDLAVAIGQGSSGATQAVAIGQGSAVSGSNSVAIGQGLTVSSVGSVAIGSGVSVSGGGSSAIGKSHTVTHTHCFFAGEACVSDQDGEIRIGNRNTGITRVSGSAVSSTTGDRRQFALDGTWVSNTDASRKARLTISAFDTAAREAIRIEASGSAAMLGFYGAAAVAKAATPTTLADVILILQNLGLCS